MEYVVKERSWAGTLTSSAVKACVVMCAHEYVSVPTSAVDF